MKRFRIIIRTAVFSAILALSSCGFFETDPVTVPAYLYVPYLQLQTTSGQGDSTSRFEDVWLYEKGNLLGNFGFPTVIPIQKTGTVEIGMDAGILRSGQDFERIPYPFIQRLFYTRDLKPNVTDTFMPVFNYFPGTQFAVQEGFEMTNTFGLNYSPRNAAGDTIIRDNGPEARISGRYSGRLEMSASSVQFEVFSNEFTKETLQKSPGAPVYLEMDYKSDVPLFVGLYSNYAGLVTTIPIFQTKPTGIKQWNKIYICLDQDISPMKATTTIQVYIGVLNTSGQKPFVYLDNIKLVHF